MRPDWLPTRRSAIAAALFGGLAGAAIFVALKLIGGL